MTRANTDPINEIRLTKVPSLFRRMNLPQVIQISQQIPSPVESAVILIQVLSTASKQCNIEYITGQLDHLVEGDIVPAVLGKRRMFRGISCDIPSTLKPGDVLYWCCEVGLVGEIRGSDIAWGQPLPVCVLGSGQVSGEHLNLKQAAIVPRLQHFDGPPNTTAPVVCVAGTATNTGKTSTVAKVIQHFKSKGQKVACAKLTGMACVKEIHKLSSTGADLVLSFADAGLPSTCGDATEVVKVALGILHQLNQMQPDVIVVEFGASFLGLYNTESVLCSPSFKQHVAAVVVSASDPVAAWGALQIMDRWAIRVTAVTGPVVNSKSFEAYIEETLEVPAEDNRGVMPRIAGLVEASLEEFRRGRASAV